MFEKQPTLKSMKSTYNDPDQPYAEPGYAQNHPAVHLFIITAALLLFSGMRFPAANAASSSNNHQTVSEASSAALPVLEFSKDDAYTCVGIVNTLERYHYSGKRLDDEMSSLIMDQYIAALDPARNLFTQKNIREFETIRYWLDNALERGNLKPGYVMFRLYLERSRQRLNHILSLLPDWQDRFNFTGTDTILLDRESAPWPADPDALKILWTRELKNDILTQKLNGDPLEEIEPSLTKRYTSRLNRLFQTNAQDVFNTYMNTVTMSFDPHTQYFPPRASEDFNIQMSLSLEGIGAVLQTEDEYTRVVRLIAAGPADKSGKLMPGDKIIGVGQGRDGEILDTIGWRIDEVVRLIRGPRNTIVRLHIIPADKKGIQHARTIVITRDKVKLEEQAASSDLVTVQQNGQTYRIGIIHLPTFYLDFKGYQEDRKNYRSTTRDVGRLIQALKKQEIDGLIMDLRDNGGGSLQEVNQLTGLFIEKGPTVQIRSRNGDMSRLEDTDKGMAYRGPLMVMINRMSASASEIFAGAVKDYHRGILVGTRTFGKGTVQAMQSLGSGQLKLTSAKFYRVSGESTQNQGVLPDIEYPPIYNSREIGESALDGALPWDTTRKALFSSFPTLDPLLPLLRDRHYARVSGHPDFTYLNEKFQLTLQMLEMKSLSLNEEIRKQQNQTLEDQELTVENRFRKAKGLTLLTASSDRDSSEDADPAEDPEMDLLLEASQQIMADFIGLAQLRGYHW